jgi:hypothetical protein
VLVKWRGIFELPDGGGSALGRKTTQHATAGSWQQETFEMKEAASA